MGFFLYIIIYIVTLPPHFSDNQVSSVRKKLKNGLLQLLRHPAAVSDFQGRITILLTDLGATHAEVRFI